MPAEATAACPKHMVYGPCGGVALDGSCELSEAIPCPFVPLETVRWEGPPSAPPAATGAAPAMRDRIRTGPIVVADFPARALDAASIALCADALRGHVDAVLTGDSGPHRVQFSPAHRAALVAEAGLTVWAGLNCRDRNRVALEGELASLARAGVAGVHCVTGDHTMTGDRPDAAPVFDLDSTRLAALAASAGHLVSVAEAPATPPVERRPDRLLEKQRAGAEICFVNHAGGAEPVAAFVTRARDAGVTVGFVPCVPLILDEGSAALLRSFTTLVLPPGLADRILRAPDQRQAGIAAAVELGLAFLAIPGVIGVNLSGGSPIGGEIALAEAMAEIGSRLAGRARTLS